MALPPSQFSIVLAAAALSLPAPAAAQDARGSASLRIIQPAGISIVRDVLANVNASMIISGSAGDAVSMAVPSAVNVTGPEGRSLTLGTNSLLISNNLILSEDSVSVSIGALAHGQSAAAPPGQYDGIMVVLAQYN